MPNTPDNTPSADAREAYAGKNPDSDYGGRWQVPGSGVVGSSVESVPVDVPKVPEQLDLFDQPTDTPTQSSPKKDKYGHVEGAAARALRAADQAYIRSQLRGK